MRDQTPEPLWNRARADYLDGLTVERVCNAYHLSRSTFYDRARREGWLRGAETRAPELNGDPKPPPPPAASLPVLAQQALDQAGAAIALGDVTAANGWLRAVQRVRALAVEEANVSNGWGWLVAQAAKAAAAAPISTPVAPEPDPVAGRAETLSQPSSEHGGEDDPLIESEGDGYWGYEGDEEVEQAASAPHRPGHAQSPQTVTAQGIGGHHPDSPDEKISEPCSTPSPAPAEPSPSVSLGLDPRGVPAAALNAPPSNHGDEDGPRVKPEGNEGGWDREGEAQVAEPLAFDTHRFTTPPPITQAEIDAAEAEFQRMEAEISALGTQVGRSSGRWLRWPVGSASSEPESEFETPPSRHAE